MRRRALLPRLCILDLRLRLCHLVIKVANRVRRILPLLPEAFSRQILGDFRGNQGEMNLPKLRERLRSLYEEQSRELLWGSDVRLFRGDRPVAG
jgi:hypothetical protein